MFASHIRDHVANTPSQWETTLHLIDWTHSQNDPCAYIHWVDTWRVKTAGLCNDTITFMLFSSIIVINWLLRLGCYLWKNRFENRLLMNDLLLYMSDMCFSLQGSRCGGGWRDNCGPNWRRLEIFRNAWWDGIQDPTIDRQIRVCKGRYGQVPWWPRFLRIGHTWVYGE